MNPTISAHELKELINTSAPRILDCRFDLTNPEDGRRRYAEGHIPNAVYLHLDEDLCGPVTAHGGRHPLPSLERMARLFARVGIRHGDTPVVAYDDDGGCFAARAWWMLRYCGHDIVRVLDGGYAAWKAAGGDSSIATPVPVPAEFVPKPREEMLVRMEQVRDRVPDELLIDCRAPERYSGKVEPLDFKAGHIPGAYNVYWREMVAQDGHCQPIVHMAELLTGVDERSIMYCGSGVTSCVNVLAAERAGLGLPRLYAGSWSDWITYPENPVVTEA